MELRGALFNLTLPPLPPIPPSTPRLDCSQITGVSCAAAGARSLVLTWALPTTGLAPDCFEVTAVEAGADHSRGSADSPGPATGSPLVGGASASAGVAGTGGDTVVPAPPSKRVGFAAKNPFGSPGDYVRERNGVRNAPRPSLSFLSDVTILSRCSNVGSMSYVTQPAL